MRTSEIGGNFDLLRASSPALRAAGSRLRSGLRSFSLLLLAVGLFGCGAKTGLYFDDAETNTEDDASVPDDLAVEDMEMPDPDRPCVEVPFDGSDIQLDLRVAAEVGRADVVFLIDNTQSMGDEIERIRSQLRDRIAPAIREAVPDSELAVATFADFPVLPYGARSDLPFELRLPMSNELPAVQAAVNSIEPSDGRDVAESQVEALYQLMTGEGILPYVEPSAGCPRGGLGYACFRPDSLPVVLVFTDNESHNGPGGDNPYVGFADDSTPHNYEETRQELVARDAVVMGFDSGAGAARGHLERLARDTGAVAAGRSLVFNIGTRGENLGTSVVDAIQTFAGTLIQDIDAQFFDAEPGDGVDARAFVEAILPIAADPPSGVSSIDTATATFRGARAGTLLRWQLILQNDAVVPGPTARRFTLEVRFRGDGRRRLRSVLVDIVIPGADGQGCEA